MGIKKYTTDLFINKADKVHNYKYNYSLVNYINSKTKIKIICSNHDNDFIFEQLPNAHLQGQGCSKCSNNNKYDTKTFVAKAKFIHNNLYDYSKVIYENAHKKINIICKKHGEFKQKPNNHLNGQGCSKCFGNKKHDLQSFITQANKIHNNKYNYDEIKYVNAKKHIKIFCPKHGYFFQQPFSHLNSKGCFKCSNKFKLTTHSFIEKARKTHNNKYDYSLVNYVRSNIKIKIICKKHGMFKQQPNNHLYGQGCLKCSVAISNLETNWLNSLNISKENRQVSLPGLPKRWKVDGYDPETKTVYEFLGSYYHGDPIRFKPFNYNKKCKKTFGQLYKETIDRETKIRKAGYNYQFIWDTDFKYQK